MFFALCVADEDSNVGAVHATPLSIFSTGFASGVAMNWFLNISTIVSVCRQKKKIVPDSKIVNDKGSRYNSKFNS